MSPRRLYPILGTAVLGAMLGLASVTEAALMATPGNDISGLDINLTALFASDATAGTTALQYEVSLGDDPGHVWQVIDFTVLRDWSEGPFASTSSPAGWSVSPIDLFVNWQVFTPGSEIDEGQSLSGFDYTYYGVAPTDQFYRYVVTRDGGTPFQVLSTDVVFQPAAIVPEPGSALLLGGPLVWLVCRRRRG